MSHGLPHFTFASSPWTISSCFSCVLTMARYRPWYGQSWLATTCGKQHTAYRLRMSALSAYRDAWLG